MSPTAEFKPEEYKCLMELIREHSYDNPATSPPEVAGKFVTQEQLDTKHGDYHLMAVLLGDLGYEDVTAPGMVECHADLWTYAHFWGPLKADNFLLPDGIPENIPALFAAQSQAKALGQVQQNATPLLRWQPRKNALQQRIISLAQRHQEKQAPASPEFTIMTDTGDDISLSVFPPSSLFFLMSSQKLKTVPRLVPEGALVPLIFDEIGGTGDQLEMRKSGLS